MKSARRSLFIGRFQPPHNGHMAMFKVAEDRGEALLILVRPTEGEMFTTDEVVAMLRAALPQAVVERLPADIGAVYYGRDVGYRVEDLANSLSPESRSISATEIRRRLNAGESLAGLVPASVIEHLQRRHDLKDRKVD